MNGLYPLFWLLLLLVFIVFMLLYAQARQRARDYRRWKRKLVDLAEHLHKLRENIDSEADRWPMYARPVLFTEIDHEAQIEFARAQQALSDADQLLPEIDSLEEPELPEQFSLIDFFNVPKNLRTIFLGNQLIGNAGALEQKILHLRDSLKSLRSNRQQVEKKRLAVEQSIEKLQARTEQIHRRSKPLDVWRSIEAHNFSWVIGVADRCQMEASNRIAVLSENDQGYIEHAAADVFVNIGNFSLDCIELFLESQKISRRYELDTFLHVFNESTGFLQSILGMEEVWSGWKKLKQVKPYIDALPITRQQAEASLRKFRNRQEYFERLLDQIQGIDVKTEIQDVEALERECTYYWYPYAEQKEPWEKALGNPATLPSRELDRFEALFLGEIQPEIHVDKVIKQSQLFALIRKVGEALVWHNTIRRLRLQLQAELGVHKEAHRLVNQLLDGQGEAAGLLARLRLALMDTSPEITEAGIMLARDYRDYSERARQVRGANFPELLDGLNQWVAKAGSLVTQHELQLEGLKASYDTYAEQIGSAIKEIGIYMNSVPPFDRQSIQLFDEIFDEGMAILSEQKTERYSWLRPNVDRMQAWSEKAEGVIPAARDVYSAFEAGSRQVEELLGLAESEIEMSRARMESSWGWYNGERLPRIDALARAFAREKNHWDRLIERNWADYNIQRAVATCHNLITFCEGVLADLTKAGDQIDQKQHQLESKAREVLSLLAHNETRLSASDRKDIRSLVEIAREYPDYDFANKVLGYAHTLTTQQPSLRARQEITKILDMHSRGG